MKIVSQILRPVPALVPALALGFSLLQASAADVYVDPPQGWQGYMNWFANNNGSMGAYAGGGAWGVQDLRAVVSGSTLTLSPNTNVYNPSDSYWVNPDGSGAKWMDANFYVQNDALLGQSVSFSGDILQNSLVSPYTCTAFIKEFDASYSLINQATASLVGGQPFSLSLTTGAGAHVQYGFELMGPDANPATVDSLGFVSVAVVPEPSILALLTLALGLPLGLLRRRQ